MEPCTIITTQANTLLAAFHERMPVILDQKDFDLWLDSNVADPQSLMPLLKPCPAEKVEAYPEGLKAMIDRAEKQKPKKKAK
jgi:putative SOS response-associated peptidase YedK